MSGSTKSRRTARVFTIYRSIGLVARRGQDPSLQTTGRWFVGDAYMRPVQFSRYIVISGRLQRAAYMPPLQMTRNVVITAKPRAGHTPPLPRNVFYCPVGRGDPTPPGNRAVDAICRFGCRGEHCSPAAKPSPLGGRWRGTRRMRGKFPVDSPSSVTCGDSFPQRGKPYHPKTPLRLCIGGALVTVFRKFVLPRRTAS